MLVEVNLDLGTNQILNFVVQGLTSDPTPAKAGAMIYRTDLGALKVCTNATGPVWTILSTGGGTVTSASVASANGFTGSVATSTTTPAITIATSVTGLLKGNGTAVSAAAAGTDYVTPSGSGAGLTGITESQVTSLVSDLAAKAPLASPALTGSPTAPTQTAADNTTKIATTAFVTTAQAASIPESQVTNLTTDLAAKAPLASPTLTGTPAAPTATAGTNTTQIATTAYVTAAVTAAVQGLVVKQSVVAATTGAETYTITSGSVVTISGTAIDGVSPSIGDRILIKDAPTASGAGSAGSSTNPNGVYTVTANTTNLTVARAADMSGTVNLPAGSFTFVESGTANDNSGWVIATPNTNTGFTYGSNAIQWVQFSGAGEVIAGTGISKSGNTISVVNPLNQNTTGTAANVTGTVAVANGGTGQVTAAAAITALTGAQTSGKVLRSDGTNATLSSLVSGDIPNNAANTTGTASNVTGTVAFANGGTGQTSQQAASDAILGAVTTGTFARGNGTHVTMQALQAADIPTNENVAPASLASGQKYAIIYNSGTKGDGSTTSFTINHNLNNLNPIVQVYAGSSFVQVICDVEYSDANNTIVIFATAPTTNSFSVVCVG